MAAALLAAAPAHAEAGDWLIRLRAIDVMPNEHANGIHPAFPGEGLGLTNNVMPEVDVTYMATRNIGFELIAATTKHKADGRTGVTGSIGRLASTWVLPPTLTVQWHFVPEGHLRPYLGAGVNYAVFYNEKASDELKAVGGADTSIHLKNGWGWAVQAGMDMDLTDRVFLNVDVKYIGMDSKLTIRSAALGEQKSNLDINPLVVGVGVGMRF
jgi:outer membrane protein